MEEGGRVPLIVAVPASRARGLHCRRIVELIDLYPTLAGRAGLEPPAGIQGKSLLPLLEDPSGPAVRDNALIQAGRHFALRTEKWALTRHAGETMLYDMAADPAQHRNLSGRPEVAEVEKKLNTRLDQRLAEARR